MDKIEVRVLNPEAVGEAERMMVCAARLTQRGHQVKSMADFLRLYGMDYKESTVSSMAALPHPTIQKFGVLNVVVVGASRRFLAQITRHQNEVKFMSASLQYSDYTGEANFVIPYSVLVAGGTAKEDYLRTCRFAMGEYEDVVRQGLDHDSAGYLAPQGLRNVVLISATPYQWKHMIGQRTCRRNTDETRYVMLRIWQELWQIEPSFFSPRTTGPFCMRGVCEEGKMSCGRPMKQNPLLLIREDFPLLAGNR